MSIEIELNELRAAIAQSASAMAPKVRKALEDRLAALEERVGAATDPSEAKRAAIMRALAVADNGKPGYLSSAQIEAVCNMTKSEVHVHVNELEKKGRVWIRKTHGTNGRPTHYVYDPRAVRA